jgi:hypothetical protein
MQANRRRTVVVTCALAVAFLSACQTALEPEVRPPDVIRADSYTGGGVAFGYPGNWALVDQVGDTDTGEVRSISVGLPGVGGAYLRVFSPPPPDLDFESFKSAFAAKVEERVPSAMSLARVKEAPVATVVAGEEREGSRREYTFRVFTAIFRMALEFHRVDVAERSVFLVTLASGDPASTSEGFDLIQKSLRVQSGTYLGGAMRDFRRPSLDDEDAPLDFLIPEGDGDSDSDSL